MDGSHYSSNVISTSASSYPSPAAISPHQLQNGHLQQNGHLPPHTLPPLQPQNPAMQSIYGSHPHTPRTTPGTPGTPQPQNNMSSYPQPPSQGAGRGGYPNMMGSQYPQPHQGYGTSSSMMPQSSVAASHPQPIAPAPASRPPVLRPMPAGGVMPTSGLSSPYGQSPLMPHQQSILQPDEQPTHVVGSQGRRGILPSAPGRPAAPTGSGASKNTVIPQKDADGKFPCPHCTKTYLHAKHLKRHLLRHTGDRPYMCVLCRDTFSRSDILKRHFQKCSIRRGNPTGASHLSHPQAHVKKHQNAQKPNEGDMAQLNGMNGMQGDNGMVHPFGIVPVNDGMPGMQGDQNQLSRSNSMTRMDDANGRDRRNMPGGSVYGNDVQNSMASNINPQLANYSMPQGQNGMAMFGGSNPPQQNMEWPMFSQPGAQDTFVNSFPPNLGQTQIATKHDSSLHGSDADAEQASGLPGSNPNDIHDRSLFFSHNHWAAPTAMHDQYQHLSSQILSFTGSVVTSQAAGVDDYFSSANIKDCLEKYTHFHVHFSILHIPTFRIMEAYTGLLAAMVCIGACYSDRFSPSQVRDMTDFLKTVLERDCSANFHAESVIPNEERTGIEKLQALVLLHALLVWNGTPFQRETSLQLFPTIADLARKHDLLRVASDASLFSVLHQPNLTLESATPDNFQWETWVEQEKRIRLMHLLYLCDVSFGLYFNSAPQFDSYEMHVPLPADDAAWEAESPTLCAEALHLYGSDAAKARNPDGSQRSKQPELNLALRALLHSSYQIHPGSTNLYGKFILIHALLAQIRLAQLQGHLNVVNGSSTPLSQNDWIFRSGSDAGSCNASANNSGRATPVSGLQQSVSPQAYQSISIALDKFKSNWDMDMAIQFPPSMQSPRRYGFSRDGIHYFWLARWLLKNGRPNDLQLPRDHRFTQVIQLLKSVKTWVMSDANTRGEELGSVGDIDHDYGVNDLTLNMASLFKPLPLIVDSQAVASVKTEF